jgi:hypothetical protein
MLIMKQTSLLLGFFGLLALVSLPTGSAHAQATRTWVSGVGDDVNPCSRTAPCKTFAGAISKTAGGGEIDCLDPGGFGAVTITKSMTIDCGSFTGGVLASGGTTGVIVNAATTDKVVLRNLVIQGLNTATPAANGIRFIGGRELELDRVVVQGFTTVGVDVNKTAQGILSVRDSYFAEGPIGIKLATTAVNITASISNTSFNNLSNNGVEAGANSFANVSNSVFSTIGGSAMVASASTATVNAANNVISNSNVGINASVAGAKINATGNKLFGNSKAFNNAGTFLTGGDNKVDVNPGDPSTNNLTTK